MGKRTLCARGCKPVLAAMRRPGRTTIRLIIGVIAWWLLMLGAIVLAVPPPTRPGTASAVAPGHVAHLATPSGAAWSIPVDRATYYEVARPSLDNDEDMVIDAGARPGWLSVRHGQEVRVVDVDRAAVQVELLEEPNIGGHGWLHLDYLRP